MVCGSHVAYGYLAFVGVCVLELPCSKMARKPRSLLQYDEFSLHHSEPELYSDSFSAVINWRSSNCSHVNPADVVVRPAALPGQLAAGNMPAGSCQQEGLGVFVILRTRT